MVLNSADEEPFQYFSEDSVVHSAATGLFDAAMRARHTAVDAMRCGAVDTQSGMSLPALSRLGFAGQACSAALRGEMGFRVASVCRSSGKWRLAFQAPRPTATPQRAVRRRAAPFGDRQAC